MMKEKISEQPNVLEILGMILVGLSIIIGALSLL